MKLRCLPLWLVCDVVAFAGMMLSFWTWHLTMMDRFSRAMERGLRRLDAEDFSPCAQLLASAEAWQRYAIARRAFQLAGLDPGNVMLLEVSPASRHYALLRRTLLYLRRAVTLDACARRMAERLARKLAHKPATPIPRDKLDITVVRFAPPFANVRLHPAARGPPLPENFQMCA